MIQVEGTHTTTYHHGKQIMVAKDPSNGQAALVILAPTGVADILPLTDEAVDALVSGLTEVKSGIHVPKVEMPGGANGTPQG